MDFVFDYTQRKSQKNISFLEYWEEKGEKLNIVSSEDIKAVRIMTIHKSKGLEFPVVIFPYNLDIYFERDPKAWYKGLAPEDYNGFDAILVNSSSGITKTGRIGSALYEEQEKEKELDSFNLLYVCLTRAIEQLYVISELKETGRKLGSSSQLFVDFLKQEGKWEEGKMTYDFGVNKRVSVLDSSKNPAALQDKFISSSWQDHQIHIVANSEILWDESRAEAIDYGNLIHEMMADIIDQTMVERTLKRWVLKGLLQTQSFSEIRLLILEIVNHPLLNEYFKEGKEVLTEREILTESGQVVIPDRLVFDDKKVTIIDYKTGKPNKNHQLQIDNYALVLHKLNFEVKDKILVYIDEEISVVKS